VDEPTKNALHAIFDFHFRKEHTGTQFSKGFPTTFLADLENLKCKRRCLERFAPLVPLEKIYKHSLRSILMDQEERGTLTLEAIQAARIVGVKKITLGALNMQPLCKSCFAFVLGLKRSA
jgi:hypothetical protein